MSKPKFISGFKTKEPVNLWLGVSLDNSRLKGDSLAVFADIANRHKKMIKKLYIVVGCEIYGHYVGKDMAKKMGDQWVLQAEEYFNEEKLKMPFQFVRWSELTSTQKYQQLFKQIKHDYETDTNFKEAVDSIAKQFHTKKKCSVENACDYLLDECAAYLMFDGKTTYPDRQLNLALQYVITKYKKPDELEYIGYEIGFVKKLSQDSIESRTTAHLSSDSLSQLNSTLEKQAELICKLTKEVSELKNMISSLIEEKTIFNNQSASPDSSGGSGKRNIKLF